jgi:hypothetical protein
MFKKLENEFHIQFPLKGSNYKKGQMMEGQTQEDCSKSYIQISGSCWGDNFQQKKINRTVARFATVSNV